MCPCNFSSFYEGFKLQIEAIASFRVIQVACGSRDAQTLALTACGKVFSWGDGDFGKLGTVLLYFKLVYYRLIFASKTANYFSPYFFYELHITKVCMFTKKYFA